MKKIIIAIGLILAGCTPPYQEIPVSCDAIEIREGGAFVACYWVGEEQVVYECPKGIETYTNDSCEFVLCKKERNIGVLLRHKF